MYIQSKINVKGIMLLCVACMSVSKAKIYREGYVNIPDYGHQTLGLHFDVKHDE